MSLASLENEINELRQLIEKAEVYGVDIELIQEANIELNCLLIKAGEECERLLRKRISM